MSDFIDFIRMLVLVVRTIVHTIIFLIGLFFLPYYVWKHYDEQKKRSAEMAFMAQKMGMQLDRPLDRHMDTFHSFLRKVKGSRRHALNVISGRSQGNSGDSSLIWQAQTPFIPRQFRGQFTYLQFRGQFTYLAGPNSIFSSD